MATSLHHDGGDGVGAASGYSTHEPIRMGISACILGQEVRYDGGHKLDRFIRDTLGQFVQFVPVCPEMEIGLGVPRETLRLEQLNAQQVRLIASKSGIDHTSRMTGYAHKRIKELAEFELCGYIVQKNSPSCGMERVRVYGPHGAPKRNGRGLFTAVLLELLPDLPVEEDGRLNDPELRENFIERVFAYRRLRSLFIRRFRLGELVAFHTREKLLILSHDRPAYERLGQLVAHAKGLSHSELAQKYQALFMLALKKLATRRKQTNTLQHAAGHLRQVLPPGEREELRELIERYRTGLIPLIVPITLLRHHVRRQGIAYLAQQTYLDPHPLELMLRNHV